MVSRPFHSHFGAVYGIDLAVGLEAHNAGALGYNDLFGLGIIGVAYADHFHHRADRDVGYPVLYGHRLVRQILGAVLIHFVAVHHQNQLIGGYSIHCCYHRIAGCSFCCSRYCCFVRNRCRRWICCTCRICCGRGCRARCWGRCYGPGRNFTWQRVCSLRLNCFLCSINSFCCTHGACKASGGADRFSKSRNGGCNLRYCQCSD
ncbi:hypothetical protein D3C73_1076850 [compost metagenome]